MAEDIYTRLLALLKTQCGCATLTAVTLDPRLERHLRADADTSDWTATLVPATATTNQFGEGVTRFFWYFAVSRQITNDACDVILVRVGVSAFRADVGLAELVD